MTDALKNTRKIVEDCVPPCPLQTSALQELAHTEAVLIDCQKAHDVTIAERDEALASIQQVRKVFYGPPSQYRVEWLNAIHDIVFDDAHYRPRKMKC